jgi:hypothetical protein
MLKLEPIRPRRGLESSCTELLVGALVYVLVAGTIMYAIAGFFSR